MPESIPAPPDGYITLDDGSEVRHIDTKRLRRSERGRFLPMPGVLVWAEGAWKPVIGFRSAFRRTVEVDYADSTNPARTVPEGDYMQRLAPERIAVDAVAGERIIAMRERRDADERARIERKAEIAAAQEAMRAAERERIERERQARLAAMSPAAKLEAVRREVAVAELRVEVQREEVERVRAKLAECEAQLAELRTREAELAAEVED